MTDNNTRQNRVSSDDASVTNITFADVLPIAKSFGFDPKMMYSSVWCESNGMVLVDGAPIVAFNPQLFQRYTAASIAGKPTWRKMPKTDIAALGYLPRYSFQPPQAGDNLIYQAPNGYRMVHGSYTNNVKSRSGIYNYSIGDRMRIEREMFEFLSHPSLREICFLSTAIGPTQIMGMNYHILGLPSAEVMYQQFFRVSTALEYIAIFYSTYNIKYNGKTIADALRTTDFDTFAALYANDRSGSYAAKLRRTYGSISL